jgi:hypothetical protein
MELCSPRAVIQSIGFSNAKRHLIAQMLGHASAAMTLDIYAGLFADDLDTVADQLQRAFAKPNAGQTASEAVNQAALAFENSPGPVAG